MRRLLLAATLACLAPSAPALAKTDFSGEWVVQPSKDFPEFTALHIKHTSKGYTGVVTSKWYGNLPMSGLHEKDGALVFQIDNGNGRVTRSDIVLSANGKDLKLKGQVWYQAFDLPVRRGTPAEMKALVFTPTILPPHRIVPENGLAKTPPMGWSSWNKFADKIDDTSVRQIADAMVSSGLRDAGYVYINIDDGWQGERDASGVLQPNAKFPDMKALADYVHSKGLKLGIYTSPGPRSCAGYEGSYGHIQQDADTYAAWGIDYLKYDLCSGEAFYHTAETVKATYQEMGEALRATHRQIVYSLCEYGRFDVGAWGREVSGNLWRTTGDIEDKYSTMAAIGFDKNGVPRHTGPGGWNDPDMLEVGNGGMTADEYRTHFSLWAMMSAPLILGNDLRDMTPETKSILMNRDVIAIDQDPAGTQGLPVFRAGTSEIWTKALSDGSLAVALFNRGAEAADMTFDPAALGLGKTKVLRDLWAGKDIAFDGTPLKFTVPAHGVVLLRGASK
jgi:alpha-galactosidase